MCILDEIGIAFSVHPDIRADQDVMLVKLLLQVKRLGGDHRVNASHLVAHFPTDLKQIVWICQFVCHLFLFYLFGCLP